MTQLVAAKIAILLLWPDGTTARASSQDKAVATRTELHRYVRAAGTEWAPESEIRIISGQDELVITSSTGREDARLRLTARFDGSRRLIAASVTTQRDGQELSAKVELVDGRARVTRHGGELDEFDCPPGVIVTSAPDWTDAVLMTKRYDRQRGGKQEFAGLWIHPTQRPLRPTFSTERLGADTIEHDGKPRSLDRFRIVLRGGSRYVAWADADGTLIRLAPEIAPPQGIMLAGWEKSASSLRVDSKP